MCIVLGNVNVYVNNGDNNVPHHYELESGNAEQDGFVMVYQRDHPSTMESTTSRSPVISPPNIVATSLDTLVNREEDRAFQSQKLDNRQMLPPLLGKASTRPTLNNLLNVNHISSASPSVSQRSRSSQNTITNTIGNSFDDQHRHQMSAPANIDLSTQPQQTEDNQYHR